MHTLYLRDFRQPDVTEASFTISSVSDLEAPYEITCDAPWLSCSSYKGVLDGKTKVTERIIVTIDRSKMTTETEARIKVKIPSGLVTIIVDAKQPDLSGLPERTFVNTYGYISIEAEHYHAKYDLPDAGFQVIEGYGRTLSGLKVFPDHQLFRTRPGAVPGIPLCCR